MDLLSSSPTQLQFFFLVAARIGAMLLTMPIFGSRIVPAVPKIGLGLLVAFALMPTIPALATPLPEGLAYLLVLGQELLVGALAGFAINLIFTAVHMAGSLAGMQLGLGIESVGIMEDSRGPALEQYYTMFATLIFLATNSHHQVLIGMRSLFDIVPLGSFIANALMGERLVVLSASMFAIAGRIALPIMGALLLTDIAMALLARIAPQMNIFFIGLPLKQVVGLYSIVLTLPLLAIQAEKVFGGLASNVYLLFGRGITP